MTKGTVIFVLVALIFSSFIHIAVTDSGGEVQEEFDDGSSEKVLTLSSSWVNGNTKFELPNRAVVTKARLNVTGVADVVNRYPIDVRVDIGDDGVDEWAFNGDGYGRFGNQSYFDDDVKIKDCEFQDPGFNNTEKLLFPKNATIVSTNLTIEGKMYGKNGNSSVPDETAAWGNYVCSPFSHSEDNSLRFTTIGPNYRFSEIKGGLIDKILFRTDNQLGYATGDVIVKNLTIYMGHWRPSSSSLKEAFWRNYDYVDDLTLVYKGNWSYTYPGANKSYIELDVDDKFIYNGNNYLFYEIWSTDRIMNVSNAYYAQFDCMYQQVPYSNGFETVWAKTYDASKGNLLTGYSLALNFISKGCYPKNVSLDLGDDGSDEWNYSSELDTKKYYTNLTAELNSLIASTPATVHDAYGNEMVEIPINISTKTMGTVSLNNLGFKYDYTFCIDKNPVYGNLTNSLNVLLPHGGDGNKTFTIAVRTGSNGALKLNDLYIEYYIPPVTVEYCKVVDGHTVGKYKCYTGYRPYTLQVGTWSKGGLTAIGDVVVAMDALAAGGPFVKLKWNRTTNTFSEIYDPSNYFSLATGTCKSWNDGVDQWFLNFTGTFSWSYPTEKFAVCNVEITYDTSKKYDRDTYGAYIIENDLDFVGTLSVTGEYQGVLADGDWVQANEKLTWKGLKVVYQGTTTIYPPNSAFRVTINDDGIGQWQNTTSSGSEFSLDTWTQGSTDPTDIHTVDITNIPGTGLDISDESFELKIDGTPPSPPSDIICYSDGPGLGSTDYDTDTTVYVNFTASALQDGESGLSGNFMAYNDTEPTTLATCGDSAVGEEGQSTFYVRAKDNVGNWGTAGSASICIDLSPIKFTDPYPNPDSWSTDMLTIVGVTITDIDGSGVAGNTIQYRYTDDGLLDTESWIDYPPTQSREEIGAVMTIGFVQDGSPIIQWRAKDLANHDCSVPDSYVTSPQYPVYIDTKIPTIEFISPKSWQNTLTPDLMLYINDTGSSGVNVSSVIYAFSTDGGVTYSD